MSRTIRLIAIVRSIITNGRPILALQTYLKAKGQDKLFQTALKEAEKSGMVDNYYSASDVYEAYQEWYASEYSWLMDDAKMLFLGLK